MNIDEEAVLGLLSIGHRSQATPSAATSSATLNSILTTTASSVIPAKRKHDDHPCLPFDHEDRHKSPPETHTDSNDTSSEALDCICGFTVDDGFSIACDICSRWCHSACFDIVRGFVPEKFLCWKCKPRSAAEKERAVKFQRENLGLDDPKRLGGKHRRTSVAAIDGGKRKRRPSVVQPTTPLVAAPPQPVEEEHVEVEEPWTQAYVHISEDIITNDETRAKLRRQAHHWRGVTAVADSSSPPPTTIKELPPLSIQNPFLALNSNPHVLPPTYGLHTTAPIPSNNLITPYKSSIAPSAQYLSDPLNAYAHLGMPKPFVHLIGPPLDVALDSRLAGNHGRFVRSGCRPNAVLRPVLCERDKNKPAPVSNTPRPFDPPAEREEDETTLGFGVFALRDLKADEEIVLGWEWDDGNAVHSLPALLKAPHAFPPRSPPTTINPSAHDCDDHKTEYSPNEITHLRNQMSNILHALSSTFTTCACGARARDCALTQMAAFVDGQSQLLTPRNHHGVTHDDEQEKDVDLGPLVGRKRGFKTRERIPFSGGMGGMEMVPPEQDNESRGRKKMTLNGYQVNATAGPSGLKPAFSIDRDHRKDLPPPLPSFALSPSSPSPSRRKGKAKAVDTDGDVQMEDGWSGRSGKRSGSVDGQAQRSDPSNPLSRLLHPDDQPIETRTHHSSELRPPDPGLQPSNDTKDGRSTSLAPDFDVEPPPATEDRMPPKMRKKWMHREVEAMKGMGSPGSADSPGESGHTNGFGHGYGGSSGKLGLGIRFGSEGVEHDEHKLMPPPPMPASLDPTTISSTDAAGVPSPQPRYHNLPHLNANSNHRLPTSTPSPSIPTFTPATATLPPSTSSPAQFSPSPLTSFANLSLLSPALLNQVQQNQQGGGSPSFPFPPLSRKVEEGEKKVFKPKIWGPLKAALPPLSSAPSLRPSSPVSSALKTSSSAKDVVRQPSPSTLAQPPQHEEEEDVKMVDGTSPRSPASTKVPLRPKSPSQDPDSVASTPPSRNDEPLPPVGDFVAEESKVARLKDEDSHMSGVDDPKEKAVEEPPSMPTSTPPHTLASRSRISTPSATTPPPRHRSKTPPRSLSPAPMDQDDSSADLDWANDTIKQSPKISPDSPPPVPSSPSRSSGADEEENASPPPMTGSTEAAMEVQRAEEREEDHEMAPPPSEALKQGVQVDTITIVVEPAPAPPLASSELATSSPVPPSAPTPSLLAPPAPPSEPTLLTSPTSSIEAPPSPKTPSVFVPEPAPAPAPPARQPSPPPPPKVKMSLRDFAARRKKLKEEAELSKSIQASPMSATSVLAATPSPMIPNVVLAEESKDKEKVALEKEKSALEKEKETKEAVEVGSAMIGVETKAEERVVAVEKKDEAKVAVVVEVSKDDRPILGGLKEARNGLNVPAITPSTTKPITNGPLFTYPSILVNGPKVEPSTFDNVASFMPSSPIGPHIPIPHVNGHSSISRSPSETFIHSPSTRGFMSSPSVIGSPLIDTHKTKQELVEHHIPPLSTSPAPPYLSSALLRRPSINDRSISPISPDPGLSSSSLFSTRIPHEEDGEIGEGSPPTSRHPLPSKRDFSFPPRSSIPTWMKSHTPPTGPRSSNAASTSPTPPFPRPAFASSQPPSSNSLPPGPLPANASAPPSNSNTANINRPMPPSAPRALRQSMASNRPPVGLPAHSSSTSQSHGPHPYGQRDPRNIPRGPLSDRDNRDRDWDHRSYRGPPRRGGWGR
ncbi:unnamed protein product [Cyclocybe aegerita]|uniref:SET domain-containing protein n=1 Tax=Cyclocybe aegerita TaxID=1973307 RepID=A0A8S0X9V8_CYCAE|nr:unnamed protein product [Cyclocybe aegerita]